MSHPTRESFVEDPQRVDQIVRVDASALLKTIRELEYKLTEHQKSEKAPAWATALEQRIEQLENTFFQSQEKPSNAGEVSAEDAAEPPSGEQESAPAAHPQITTDEADHHKRSVGDMATEMRVISKVRKEIDNKFHTAENHLDTKISSFNLQLDRLMKLLQIRPTTSELQTVMNAVYDVDKKVQNQMEDIKNDVRATLKSKLSEEILTIIEEVHQSKDLSDSGIKYIQRTVDGFASELNDVREVTENTVLGIHDELEKLRKHNTELEECVVTMKAQMERNLQEQSALIAEMKAEQLEFSEQFAYFKNRTEEETVNASMAVAEEKARIDEEIARLDYALSQSNSKIDANQTYIVAIQGKAESELVAQGKINKAVQEALVDNVGKVDKIRKDVEALTNSDFNAQIKILEEALRKTNLGVTVCQDSIEKYINGDLKTINLKVSLLQEQCNIQIPNAYAEMSLRIDGMTEQMISSNNSIDKLQQRIQATDDTVGELMPLLDRTTSLEVHSKDHIHELASLKDGLTNTIDTTDELTRRIEEMEEGMEGMESSVTNRMNQMRDTLIDTVLEKQSETNTAMRNVRENLEVMARAGEGPVTAATMSNLTGASGGKAMAMGPGVSGKMSGGMSSKAGPAVSAKMTMPVQVPTASMSAPQQPQQVQQQQVAQQPASASFAAASHASSKSGSAGNRKQSNGGANVGTRASISSEADSFQDDAESFVGGNSMSYSSSVGGGNSYVSAGAMQGAAVTAYQRPGMAGQELRGTAPPTMVRQPSTSGVGMLSRQPSKAGNDFVVPAMPHQQTPQRSSFSSPGAVTPPPQQQYQQQQQHVMHHAYGNNNNGGAESPTPQMESNEYVQQHFDAGNVDNSGGFEQTSPRPSSGAAQRAIHAQQAMYQSYSQPAISTSQQQSQQPRAAPQGQVRYTAQPQQQQMAKYEPPPERNQSARPIFTDALEPTNINSLVPHDYQHFQQAQFLADLCLNFEEISVKRKRVANVPTVMCESIADITQDIAEFMAKTSDYEMVQYMLASVAGLTSANDINYDENLVLTKRNAKVEEYLQSVTNLIILTTRNQQPGIVRLDARSLFVSLVKKSLDMFMSKHNQVLVVGNSRLGRVKIPSCLACDRPLIDKVRLDSVASRGGMRGELGSASMLSHPASPGHHFGGGNNNNNNLSNLNNNLSNVGSTASYGYGAPVDGGGSLLRGGGESDEDEPPASSSAPQTSLAPINRKGSQSAAAGMRKKSSVSDGTKLPEVQ